LTTYSKSKGTGGDPGKAMLANGTKRQKKLGGFSALALLIRNNSSVELAKSHMRMGR
jgi:hypothetical protein